MMAHNENDDAADDVVDAASAQGVKKTPKSAFEKPEEAPEFSSLVSAHFRYQPTSGVSHFLVSAFLCVGIFWCQRKGSLMMLKPGNALNVKETMRLMMTVGIN